VLAPASIALLCVVGGTLITQTGASAYPHAWFLAIIGALVALYLFMADAIRVASQGERAVRSVLPTQFDWAPFVAAFALMSAPIAEMIWKKLAKVSAASPMGRFAQNEPSQSMGAQ
jgi:hypothetical protein